MDQANKLDNIYHIVLRKKNNQFQHILKINNKKTVYISGELHNSYKSSVVDILTELQHYLDPEQSIYNTVSMEEVKKFNPNNLRNDLVIYAGDEFASILHNYILDDSEIKVKTIKESNKIDNLEGIKEFVNEQLV